MLTGNLYSAFPNTVSRPDIENLIQQSKAFLAVPQNIRTQGEKPATTSKDSTTSATEQSSVSKAEPKLLEKTEL
jgi:hypothetical protein